MTSASQLPPTLVQYLVDRRCILLLGPDISTPAGGYRGLPTSGQLAHELAERSGYRGPYQPLPRIAQIYQHQFGNVELVRYLRERLGDERYRPLPIHEIIARLPFRFIIHGGWDRLLERALDQRGVPYHVIHDATDLGYANDSTLAIYKPYGSLDRPESLVITQEQQFELVQRSHLLLGDLGRLIASYCLLMVGYALDYDAIFIQVYHQVRAAQTQHQPPTFVAQSVHRPDDAAYWETLNAVPVITDPARFLYDLAQRVAEVEGRAIDLPDLETLSQAEPATQAEVQAQATVVNRVMDSLGISELVEQTDVPLLSREQVRDLEAMRAAYERLSEGLGETSESASLWLRQGNIEYARENYDRAEQYYQRALAADPGSADAYHNLHYAYLAQSALLAASPLRARQKLEAALQAYREAIARKPSLAVLPPRYTIDTILGQGGIGVVYRARDGESGQPVAIKVLKRAFLYNEQALRRFQREARLLQTLSHPHIVHYLDFDQHDGHYYIVMEYLEGQSVEEMLRDGQRFELDEANDVVQQVGAALQATHERGIVHRDIKPSNIFLVAGQAKVIDFGLAADLSQGDPSRIGVATGSVRYMAPEQQQGRAVDARTDEYALATVFYQMLSLRQPDEGTYRSLSELVDGVQPSLDLVVEKARQHEPDARYPDVATFCAELAQVVPTQPASRRVAPWRRALAHVQRGITLATSDHWWLLPSLTLGLGLLAVGGLPFSVRLPVLFVSVLLWDVFLITLILRLFLTTLARRTGHASLVAYGPLVGALLGIGIAVTMWVIINTGGQSEPRTDVVEFFLLLIAHGLAALVVGGLGLSSIVSGARLAARLRMPALAGLLLGYGAALALLLALVALLRSLFF